MTPPFPPEPNTSESGDLPSHPPGLDLDPEAMRALGYQAVDALVERWAGLRDDVPWRGAPYQDLRDRFGGEGPAPEEGEGAAAVLEEAIRDVLPLAARVDHPRFLAFIPSAPTWPSVLGDFLASGFNVFQGTWLGSAGPSRVELMVLEWFRQWLGMPSGAGGLLTSGGSAANLVAVAVAREAAGNPSRPVVYLSDQGHSSLLRACRIAGIPREGIRILPTGPDLRLDPSRVRTAVERDRAEGAVPILVCANGGTTNTGSVDPLAALASLTRELGLRLHVDGAFGGFGVLCEKGARALDGIGQADSVTLDPHKWLFQTFECGCLLVRDPGELDRAFRVTPEYLQDTQLGAEQVNFGDRGVQLSRSFRALKIWMSVRSFGLNAFRTAVAHGIDRAEEVEARVRASRELELLSPASLGIVTYRFRPRGWEDEGPLEALNRGIQGRLREEGTAMTSSTRLNNRFALRVCVLNPHTTRKDLDDLLDRVERLGRDLAEAYRTPGERPR
ncbi:MAG: aminotransferase class I/II-fold pyridoxal phosphate-dependent enzyme [Gemmatimonadales bacterium]|nr:MAG: aminotransferase class I/II-fold pyridoxal phosphate-dependent enzyme [Gemmatimonadales bacterium]